MMAEKKKHKKVVKCKPESIVSTKNTKIIPY